MKTLCFCFLIVSSSLFSDMMTPTTCQPIIPTGKSMTDLDCSLVILSASYTLWTARESGLQMSVGSIGFANTGELPQHPVQHPEWNLVSGFKVGVGVQFPNDGWVLFAQYTWFYNKQNDTNKRSYFANQYPVWPVQMPNTEAATFIVPRWQNTFNRVDCTLMRTFFVGHYVTFGPFFGLLSWWDYQWLDGAYFTHGERHLATGVIKARQGAWGIGPYGGYDLSFYLYNDNMNFFSLFFHWGVSMPWSQFRATAKTHTDSTNIDTDSLVLQRSKDVVWTTTQVQEIVLGFRWEVWVADIWSFLLQAGWELQVYTNHNHMYNILYYPQGFGSANYTMQGLTIKVGFAF